MLSGDTGAAGTGETAPARDSGTVESSEAVPAGESEAAEQAEEAPTLQSSDYAIAIEPEGAEKAPALESSDYTIAIEPGSAEKAEDDGEMAERPSTTAIDVTLPAPEATQSSENLPTTDQPATTTDDASHAKLLEPSVTEEATTERSGH